MNYQRTEGNEVWLTPPGIVQQLGPFDLDPCSPIDRPWDTALRHYTKHDNGLLLPWEGRVWLNPPYGTQLKRWLELMAMHGDGTALIFSRTDTAALQDYVFGTADSFFFMRGRLRFYDSEGNESKQNAPAPSLLVAYTEYDSERIAESALKGAHIPLTPIVCFFPALSGETWKVVVDHAMQKISEPVTPSSLYQLVLRLAPGKVRANKHYKAKVRQVLQKHFERVAPGKYQRKTNTP